MASVWKICMFVGLAYLALLPGNVSGKTINVAKRLHTDLLADYNKDVRPVVNQTHPVYLNVTLGLLSLQSLEEVTGTFTFVGMFIFMWMDESMAWNPELYNGTGSVSISQKKVWFPTFVLLSAADEIQIIGRNEFYQVKYYSNGLSTFWSSERVQSACSVDVRNYPFDIQVCYVIFTVLGVTEEELRLVSTNDKVNMQYFLGENAVWTIKETSVTIKSDLVMYFTFQLKRKSGFVIINVLMPITLLGFLNVLVFLLVPESGERISYCITVLLAISVFMTIISDTLPKSSEPVPIISYKLMIDVVISMLITVVTILNLRFYNKDEAKQIPTPLMKLYLTLCCWSCKAKEFKHVQKRYNADGDHVPDNERPIAVTRIINGQYEHQESNEGREDMTGKTDYSSNSENKVTWKNIASMIDGFAFIIFTVAIVVSFILFIKLTGD